MSYQLDSPMLWKEFKEMPERIQAEYIQGLVEKYGVNSTNLATMFGVSPPTVRNFINQKGLDITFKAGTYMTSVRREVWEKFLNEDKEAVEPVYESDETQPVTLEEIISPKRSRIEKFSISFSGMIDANMIANSLLSILGTNAVGDIEINCIIQHPDA